MLRGRFKKLDSRGRLMRTNVLKYSEHLLNFVRNARGD